MTDNFERYAIYWVPARPDSLCRFGCTWMGWCAELGELRPRQPIPGLTDDIGAATRRLWRHGLHAVVAGPFQLRDRASLWRVEDALHRITNDLSPVSLPPFDLAVIGGQVALVPGNPSRELAEAVARVDDAIAKITVKAPPGEQPHGPGAAADILSQLPVSPAHRFHLPLTDRIDLGTAFRIRNELAPRLRAMLAQPRWLMDLALMGDPGGDRPIRALQRFPLCKDVAARTEAVLPCYGPPTLMSWHDESLSFADLAV